MRFLIAVVVGALVAVLPAVAGSETVPSVTAYNELGIYGAHYWEPMSVSVEPGGTVDVSNNTTTYHGVRWLEGPETPTCTSGVIVGTTETQSGTNWSGSCTFTKPGVYTFDCTVHGPAMKGTITVGPQGVTTTSTSTQTQTPTQPPAVPGTETSPPPTEEHTTSLGSLLALPAAHAVKLAPTHHGATLHGTLALAAGAQGGTLAVAVLAGRVALGRHHGPAKVRIAHLSRHPLTGTNVSFSLALDALARHALRVHDHLALTVKIVLTPSNGKEALALTRTLTVTLRG
jgi:plastocyanin